MHGIVYASAYLGIALVTYVIGSWITYFYAPPVDSGLMIRLSPALTGVAVALGRVVDAVLDPLVAAWSDRHKSPQGRRMPFLRRSALPLALTFALLWTPPASLSPVGAFFYLTILLSLFFAFFTLYVAPYLALLPELAETTEKRIAWSGLQGLFNIVGIAVGGLGAGLLIGSSGFTAMGIILGFIALISFLPAAYGLRETRGSQEAVSLPLKETMKRAWENPSFRPYVIGQFFFWLALYIVMAGTPYLVTVVMGGSEADATLALGISLLVALVSLAPLARVSRKLGLKRTLSLSMAWFCLILLSWGGIGRWALPLSPYAQGLIVFALAGVPLAALFVLPNALLAEVTDVDFQRTGSRREAIYFGVQGLIVKFAVGLSALVTTQVIEAFGYSQEAPWGVLWLGPVAAAFVAAGLIGFRPYPGTSVGAAAGSNPIATDGYRVNQ